MRSCLAPGPERNISGKTDGIQIKLSLVNNSIVSFLVLVIVSWLYKMLVLEEVE